MIAGVVGNSRYADLRGLLARLSGAVPRLGMELRTEEELAGWWPSAVPLLDFSAERPGVMLSFGGDGTLLRTARLVADREIPILAVNLGRVGFLTGCAPEGLESALEAVAAGRHTLDERGALRSVITGPDGDRVAAGALNDVVVHKGGVARVVRLGVTVDGEFVGAFSSDGLIVTTPTGSTAYSLSAGGPIVIPGVDALVVTPICPHTLAVRPLVVPGGAEISIEILPPMGEDDVLVSFDGQVGTALDPDERIVVTRAPWRVHLVRLASEGFFARLRRKLQWGDLSDRERP